MNKLFSRKLIVAIGAAIVAFVAQYWPDQQDLAQQVVTLGVAYLAAQGVVDAVAASKQDGKK